VGGPLLGSPPCPRGQRGRGEAAGGGAGAAAPQRGPRRFFPPPAPRAAAPPPSPGRPFKEVRRAFRSGVVIGFTPPGRAAAVALNPKDWDAVPAGSQLVFVASSQSVQRADAPPSVGGVGAPASGEGGDLGAGAPALGERG
jgi:hypothetical protein